MKILLVICILLCGCSAKKEESNPEYKDGIYETSAQGYGGEISVTTSFVNGELNEIVVNNHNETPSIGGIALESLIKEIKEKKDYNVDIVSGATLSSEALKKAVEEAFNQAKNK